MAGRCGGRCSPFLQLFVDLKHKQFLHGRFGDRYAVGAGIAAKSRNDLCPGPSGSVQSMIE